MDVALLAAALTQMLAPALPHLVHNLLYRSPIRRCFAHPSW